jgi:hypothetical protein
VQFTLETAHLPHVTSARFIESELEPPSDVCVPPAVMIDVDEAAEERVGLFVEAARFLRRKVRKYVRIARSVISRS